MLPGFRFLLAAMVLTTSMLIFGLGAAALLRAAHEEFASIPSRRALPETVFAQQSDARPTLTMMRVESAAEQKDIGPQAAGEAPVAIPSLEQAAVAFPPAEPETTTAAEPDKIAALTDVAPPAENSPASENPKPGASISEIPVQAEAPSPAVETAVAAIAEITPIPPNQVAAPIPDQPTATIEDSTRIAETKIATLGGPPVTIETNTPSKVAPAVKKSAQAKRVVKRRRIAQRAHATQQASQKPVDPFGQPLGR